MITITLAQTDDDLRGILTLQQQNQVKNISPESQSRDGFVTLLYTLDQMQVMHAAGPSVLAKDEDRVVGYAITAMPAVRDAVPELESLFNLCETLPYKGKPISQYAYYLMGQVCVADGYRGQGLFDKLYAHHRATYGNRHQLLVTDISTRNTRSLRAHERVGFQKVHEFYEPNAGETWQVVVWDWNLV
ncbi:GNAT family N-acetyltransferase [Spirosoma montaniterrae]|uniref:Acetyltransferase n=1 Tax=Spirosoma montaniterrae TaxID=1178516 RepID=A0A1P9WS58_9BACT|nr:GNAT family N-acetyltransferase [Spirosoma montaniterrae]AQG78192.1 acetyltransferase [Spirosoma montaniterrae]